MKKYLEQTEWFFNQKPDGRKGKRWKEQCFVSGTRWIYDEDTGTLRGDGMTISGPQAEDIRAICKEVEPGFGVMVLDCYYQEVIGRLIDEGKVSVADIQKVLNDDYDDDDADDELEAMDDSECQKFNRRHFLNREKYNYRHWLSLTPPSNALIEAVAEDEKRDAIHREYEELTKPKP